MLAFTKPKISLTHHENTFEIHDGGNEDVNSKFWLYHVLLNVIKTAIWFKLVENTYVDADVSDPLKKDLSQKCNSNLDSI